MPATVITPGGPVAWRLPGCRPHNGGFRANSVKIGFVRHFFDRCRSLHGSPRTTASGLLPANVISVLNARDEVWAEEDPAQFLSLDTAFYQQTNVRHKGVYIWVHLQQSHKHYVGSYHSTSLFQRTREHITSANAMSYAPRQPWWRHCAAARPRAAADVLPAGAYCSVLTRVVLPVHSVWLQHSHRPASSLPAAHFCARQLCC